MDTNNIINKKPWVVAVVIVFVLTLWMLSGVFSHGDEAAGDTRNKLEKKWLTKVRVEQKRATLITRVIELHGRTEADRSARLRSEASGRVESILVKRGDWVKKSQVLIKLAVKDKELRLRQAIARLRLRELEFKAAKRLGKIGLTAQTQLAENQANLELAKAEVEQAKLDITYTEISAPFDGIFNERFVEVGDLLSVDSEVGEILDINPIVVRGNIPELAVANVSIDQPGLAKLITSQNYEGKVRYISAASNDDTHTFKVELAIDNIERDIPIGISATIALQTAQTLAHKISPAALSLGKDGELGIKVIDDENRVHFKAVEMVRSEKDGVWLAGLNDIENIIVVGQGFVADGDFVEPDYINLGSKAESYE